jgi:hypothetical protein
VWVIINGRRYNKAQIGWMQADGQDSSVLLMSVSGNDVRVKLANSGAVTAAITAIIGSDTVVTP